MNAKPKTSAEESMRVLVLAPRGRDGQLTRELLEARAIECAGCADMNELCTKIEEGAGAAIVTEDALGPEARARFQRFLSTQQPWSDFQLIVFGDQRGVRSGMEPATRLAAFGNVSFIDRPVNVSEMLSAVHGALRARRKQYEARRAIHSRDQFLAMLGHELRNPLGAIHLAVQMETQRSESDPRAVPNKHIAVIARQARHLAHLVDDLLDVARVTYGKVVLKQTRLNLNEVLQACQQTLEHEVRAHDLSMTLSLAPEALPVLGDSVRLEQVFGNLITNAIKYTPAGGRIAITITRDNDTAVVRVADSGIGMDASMLPHVFELFAQADRSLDRAQGGMGLGLTLVQSLVRLHAGEVEARSAGLGHGSELIVRLPLATEPVDAVVQDTRRSANSTSLRVTLVEDNEDLREMLEEMLVSRGHCVTTAEDGPAGVAQILLVKPDIAFVDVGLPGFDGFEVARRVRSQDASVRLVAVTGYGQPEDRARALDAGFDHQLTKPVNFEDIEAALPAHGSH